MVSGMNKITIVPVMTSKEAYSAGLVLTANS